MCIVYCIPCCKCTLKTGLHYSIECTLLVCCCFRIPLVPRRPVSPDPNAAAAKTKDAKGKKPTTTTMDELPPPPTDPDEKLVYDGHCNAVISVDKMVRRVSRRVDVTCWGICEKILQSGLCRCVTIIVQFWKSLQVRDSIVLDNPSYGRKASRHIWGSLTNMPALFMPCMKRSRNHNVCYRALFADINM